MGQHGKSTLPRLPHIGSSHTRVHSTNSNTAWTSSYG
ncbi:hypothetical protein F383_36675 [Gossypium arboreum]|uniref:Uncharacterized protein n=1 Tax=Gossypium arboreum TaxID=29729 RepID=A0A0B0MAV8_GOSAR|nr:hypothetical protein F383_36675 [Gossypium arboreum]